MLTHSVDLFNEGPQVRRGFPHMSHRAGCSHHCHPSRGEDEAYLHHAKAQSPPLPQHAHVHRVVVVVVLLLLLLVVVVLVLVVLVLFASLG